MRAFWMLAGVGLMFSLPLWAAVRQGATRARRVEGAAPGFFLHGRTARYSVKVCARKCAHCSWTWARRDLKVSLWLQRIRALGPRFLGPRLSIVFSSPALPDAAASAARRRLVAVEARYESFHAHQRRFPNYGVGDCELVEELRARSAPILHERL